MSDLDDYTYSQLRQLLSHPFTPYDLCKILVPPDVEIEQAHIEVAAHVIKTTFPTSTSSPNLLNHFELSLDAFEAGVRMVKHVKDLINGYVLPPHSGGSWPEQVKSSDEGKAIVFIGGLSSAISAELVAALFGQFGNYTGIKMLCKRKDASGCAFVHYEDRSSAEDAIRLMQGFVIEDCQLRCAWGKTRVGDRPENFQYTRNMSAPYPSRSPPTTTFHSASSSRSAIHYPERIANQRNNTGRSDNVMVEVAKEIDVRTARHILNVVDEQCQGDISQFINSLRTIVAIKSISPKSDSPSSLDQVDLATIWSEPNFEGLGPQNSSLSSTESATTPLQPVTPRSEDGRQRSSISGMSTFSNGSSYTSGAQPWFSANMPHTECENYHWSCPKQNSDLGLSFCQVKAT